MSNVYDAYTMQGQFTYDAHTSTPQKDRPIVYTMLIPCKDNSHMMPIQTHPKVRTDQLYIQCKDNSHTMSIQTHPKVPKPSSYHVNTLFVLTYMTYGLAFLPLFLFPLSLLFLVDLGCSFVPFQDLDSILWLCIIH